MPSHRHASLAYAEGYVAEDDVLVSARREARRLGIVPVEPGTGAALRLLAATLAARSVVDVGTGAGVSGIYLLRGMRPDGVLTTVDEDTQGSQAARRAFADAGFAASRTRVIGGASGSVLPRLADGGYDMVFCGGPGSDHLAGYEEALRLLRPGGLVAFDGALGQDRVVDPSIRDARTSALRYLHRQVAEDTRLLPALLPTGDGLLCAVKRP
ncbi:O-methyltransferase [Catenulispora sp. GAS73]|uniref:O-methyltransferase n=1 Tax=Catenulispora sp. GAS73 TaxID=3156269 RepID=UPI0035125A17